MGHHDGKKRPRGGVRLRNFFGRSNHYSIRGGEARRGGIRGPRVSYRDVPAQFFSESDQGAGIIAGAEKEQGGRGVNYFLKTIGRRTVPVGCKGGAPSAGARVGRAEGGGVPCA